MKIQIEKTKNGTEMWYWRSDNFHNPFRTNTDIEKLTEDELREVINALHAGVTRLGNLLLKMQKERL